MPVVPNHYDGVSMICSFGAQFTYKDGKYVVWERLVPLVLKLHVGVSMTLPLGTTDLSCYKLPFNQT